MKNHLAIRRELRNAKRIIGNPELFSESLIKLAWLAINSANKKRIFLSSKPYQQAAAAYEIADDLA